MAEAAPRAGLRQWVGLTVLSLPALVIALDFTVLHLAVPQLSADLQPTSTQMLWIVDIYGFMIAGLLVAMGTLGDRIGRRRLLLTGALAFGAASVLAALATSAAILILARALLGITGATLLPSTLSLISNMFRDPVQRRFAIAVWSANFMLGGALGPLVGGLLLEAFWWGSVFLPAVPVMLTLVALGPLVLPEYRSGSAGRPDLASVALAIAGSIGTAVYRHQVSRADLPANTPPDAAQAARDTLGGAVATADRLAEPAAGRLVAAAREAFVQGMQVSTVVLALLLGAVTITVAALLRGTATQDAHEHHDQAQPSDTA